MAWTVEQERAYQKAYRESHKEELRNYGRAYYAANREYHVEYQRAHRRAHKTEIASRNREAKYELSEAEFQALLVEQNNACAICQEPFTETPQVDHDHSCCGDEKACAGCRRGLLCKHCNRGIGCLKESEDILRRAMTYLAKYGNRDTKQ